MFIDNRYVSIQLLINFDYFNVTNIIKFEKLSFLIKELIEDFLFKLNIKNINKMNMIVVNNKEDFNKYNNEDSICILCESNDIESIISSIMSKYVEVMYLTSFNNTYDWIKEGLSDFYKYEYDGLNINGAKFKSFFLSNILNKKCNDKKLNYIALRYMIKHFKPDHLNEILNDSDRINNVYSYIFDKAIRKYSELYHITDQIFDESYITSVDTLMDYMDANIIYGWKDINGEEHIHSTKDITSLYRINSLDTLRETHLGTCVEQTNFVKYHLERLGYETKIITKRYNDPEDNSRLKLHCICAFKNENNEWVSFEHIVKQRKGLTIYKSFDDLIEDMQFRKLDSTITIVPELPVNLSFNELIDYIAGYDIENPNKLKRELN